MKNRILSLGLVVAGFSLLATGCVERRVVVRERAAVVSRPAEVEVVEAPPAPRVEVVAVAPSPAHFWIPGHWAWRDGAWVWLGGHWELRPRPHAVWISGEWVHRGHGHVWVGGYWR